MGIMRIICAVHKDVDVTISFVMYAPLAVGFSTPLE
jgi:hypothetical protein